MSIKAHSASATAIKAKILPSRNSCDEMLETYTCRMVFCSDSFAIARAASKAGNIDSPSTNTPGPKNFFDDRPGLYQSRMAACTSCDCCDCPEFVLRWL